MTIKTNNKNYFIYFYILLIGFNRTYSLILFFLILLYKCKYIN